MASSKALNSLKSASVKKIRRVVNPESPTMRYVMMIAIAMLLAFTVYYVYTIVKTNADTEKYVNSSSKTYKVVFIFSNNCGYCTLFKPTFATALATLGIPNTNVDVVQLESSDPAAAEYNNQSSGVPFVLIYKDGVIVDKKTGNVEQEVFNGWLRRNLSI